MKHKAFTLALCLENLVNHNTYGVIYRVCPVGHVAVAFLVIISTNRPNWKKSIKYGQYEKINKVKVSWEAYQK